MGNSLVLPALLGLVEELLLVVSAFGIIEGSPEDVFHLRVPRREPVDALLGGLREFHLALAVASHPQLRLLRLAERLQVGVHSFFVDGGRLLTRGRSTRLRDVRWRRGLRLRFRERCHLRSRGVQLSSRVDLSRVVVSVFFRNLPQCFQVPHLVLNPSSLVHFSSNRRAVLIADPDLVTATGPREAHKQMLRSHARALRPEAQSVRKNRAPAPRHT